MREGTVVNKDRHDRGKHTHGLKRQKKRAKQKPGKRVTRGKGGELTTVPQKGRKKMRNSQKKSRRSSGANTD